MPDWIPDKEEKDWIPDDNTSSEWQPDTPTGDQIKSSMMTFGEKTVMEGPFAAAYDKIMERINGTEQERTRGYLAMVYAQSLNLNPSFAYRHKESIDNWYKTKPEEAAKRDAIMAKIRAYNDTGLEGDSYLTTMYKRLRGVPFEIQAAAGGVLTFLEENADPYSLGQRVAAEFTDDESQKQTLLAAADAWDAKQIRRGQEIIKGAEAKKKKWEPDVIPGSFKDVVGMATDTTINNLILLATLGPIGRGAYLTGFGTQAFGQSYEEQRKGGSSKSTATIASLINAGSEVATEFIPAGIYLKPTRRLVEQFVKAQFAEIPGESINQVINDVVDKVTIHPDMTLAQAIDNVVTTIQVTALSTGALATTTHSVNKVLVKTLMPTHGDIVKKEIDKSLLNGDTPQTALKKGVDAAAQTLEGKQIIDDKVNQLKKEAVEFGKERSTKPFIIGTEESAQGDVSTFIMADPVTGRTLTVPAMQESEKGEKTKLIPDAEAVATEMEKIRLSEEENFDVAVTDFLESGQDIDTFINTIFGEEQDLTEAPEDATITTKGEQADGQYSDIELNNAYDILNEAGKVKGINIFDPNTGQLSGSVTELIRSFPEEEIQAKLGESAEIVREREQDDAEFFKLVEGIKTAKTGMAIPNVAKAEALSKTRTAKKAKQPTAEAALIAEARKYKTAEEFVEKIYSPMDRIKSAEIDNIFNSLPDGTITPDGYIKKIRGKLYPTEKATPELLKNSGVSLNADGSIKEGFGLNRTSFTEDVFSKSQLTDIWNKAQEKQPTADQNLPQAEISPDIQRIKQTISMKDFRDIIERYFPQVKDYYEEEGIKTVDDYLAKLDTDIIDMEISSHETPTNAIRKLLGNDEFAWDEVSFSDIIDLYKKKELVPTIDRKAFKISGQKIENIPVKGQSAFYETTNIKTPENIQTIYNKATERVTEKNRTEINEARKKLFLAWASDSDLHNKLNLTKSELNKKIKTYTGANISDVSVQNRVNEGVPDQFHWTGITNSNYINKTDISLADIDNVVANINDNTANRRFGSPDGNLLRRFIMNTFLAIDTRLKYNDLNFVVSHLEKALGEYSNKNLTITISSSSQNTVAHEIGHYLDYRFAREMGLDLRGLSDGGYNFAYIKEKNNLSDEHIKWAEDFISFIDNLRTKGDIGHTADRATYLQRPTEVFARFVAKFVDWTSSKAGFKHSELNYYSDRFSENDFNNFIKLLQKKAEIDSKYNITPIVKGAGEDINASKGNNERGSFSTKKGAQNLVTRIIELGGIKFKQDYDTSLLRQDVDSKRVINNKTGRALDDITAQLQAEGWAIESSDQLVELLKSGQARTIYAPEKADELYARKAGKLQEEYIQGEMANLGLDYKDVKEIKAELTKAQKEYREGNKAVKDQVKQNLLWIARRLESLRAVRDSLNLTEAQMKNVSRRNPLLMDAGEFKKYLNDVELRALELAEERHARQSLIKLIADKNLKKVENYRQAMELPPINQMTTQQLNTFFELLEPFQDDDVFLTGRELETVDRTEFKGVRTRREVRQKIAENLGIPPEDIKPVHSDWMDSYRWDTALREQGPIYQLVVETMMRKQIAAELRAHEIESEVYAMAKKARKSSSKTLTEKLIPQDEKIIAYLEVPAEEKSKVAATMTKEELALAHYAQQYYADFLSYLLSIRAIDRGRQNYFTHVRRSFLETVKDDGIKAAFTNYFKNMEQDQIVFNILDEDTGKILPLEKFFQFSMRRTGGLQPTQNFVKAFMTYVNTAEKKRMYDETIPLLDIIAQAVTPQEYTPRGLEIDRSFKKFINEWINNKKGRRINYMKIRQGSTPDVAIRAMRTFTMIRDLGLNIPIGIAATMGEQVTNATMLGWKGWTKGTARMRTDQGKKILKKYEGWVGRGVWEELSAPGKQISERLVEGMMSLFRLSTVTANKQFLLGSMTDAEFKNGVISEQRLAGLRLDMGRFRVVEGTSSLVGSTSVGSAGMQYKKWAVPILRTTVQDIKKTISDLKTKPFGEKLASREAQEVKRILYISGMMFIVGGLIGADDDDDSVFGKLKGRVYREGMTLMQGISPRLWLTSPRTLTFLYQLGDMLESIIRLETYKRTGDLKAINKAKRIFVPAAVAPLINDEKKKERR